MGQSSHGSLQCDSSDEEDRQNNVREDCSEVNNFSGGSNTLHVKISILAIFQHNKILKDNTNLHKNEIDNDPGQNQTQEYPVLDAHRIICSINMKDILLSSQVFVQPIAPEASRVVLNQKY